MNIAKLVKDRRSKNNIDHNTDVHNKKDNKKWASFSYVGKEVIPIAKILKKFNIKVAFRTRNTLENWLGCKQLYPNEDKGDKYDTCGIYKLNCRSCDGSYIGQTGRNFKTRFKEHVNDIKNNRGKTGYSQHILENGHERAHNLTDLIILEKRNKGPLLNTLEKFHIFKTKKENILLNDVQFDLNNPIYEVIDQYDPQIHNY